MIEQETVPCRFCRIPTPMLGTTLCDGCYEIVSRLDWFIYRGPEALEFVERAVKDYKDYTKRTKKSYDERVGE